MVTLTLDRSKSQPLYLQLEQAILKQIDAGLARPGDRLPSERELSEILGISRQTVRLTINQLVLRGLLYRQPGKGTYVRPRKTAVGRSQVAIASQLLFDWDQQTTVWLGAPWLVPAPGFAAGLLGVERGSPLVAFEHIQISRGMPVNYFRSWMPVDFEQALLSSPLDEPSILDLFLNRCGANVIASRDRAEPSTSGAKEAAALGIQPGSPVQLVTGMFLIASGRSIEAHKMVIRGDRFHLDFESHFAGAQIPGP